MNFIEQIQAAIANWFTSSETLRAASAHLRAHVPIVEVGDRVAVFKYDDVIEVLARNDRFGVSEIYAAKMERTTGAFFLGMEDTQQYRREAQIARHAVRSDDGPRIAQIASEAARELLAKVAPRGTFDAVGEFSHLIPVRLLASYFGTPGPDVVTMQRWMRAIFWDIFLNPNDDPSVCEKSRVASAEVTPYLAGLIAERKRALDSGQRVADDFVTRLLMQQKEDSSIDDDLIRRDISGIIVGAVDTQSKAIAHSIDQLLRRPDALESARRAALADDDASVAAHVWEALRFNPHNPVLFRHCHADTMVAAGTDRQKVIAKGETVIAMTLSAMFDPDALDRPDEFSTSRPLSAYLHFGHGQHTCFGERINLIVVPLAVKALLKLPNLRYAEGANGAIEYEGPFPDRMMLSFDPR
jgi:cytochrome P450